MYSNIEAVLAAKGIQISSIKNLRHVHPEVCIESPCVLQGEIFLDLPIKVGAFTGVYGARLRYVEIGRYCSVAPGLQTGWDEHPTDRLTTSMIAYVPNIHGWAQHLQANTNESSNSFHPFSSLRGKTIIGNDVWIGSNVFLRTGITIGDGAIIGAGSVVTSDIPAFTIVGGTPAKHIRDRFPQEIAKRLQQSKWWQYSILDMPPGLLHHPDAALDWLDAAVSDGRISPFVPVRACGNELS